MKKVLAVVMCVILALALPLVATAAGGNKGPTNEKDIKTKEIPMEVSLLPDEIYEGDEVEITFTVPRSGSGWEYGEIFGLTNPETVFDEETCMYITTAMIDTSIAGPLDIVFNFIMSAGKSHIRFASIFEASVVILGETKTSNITYYWNQDFSDNYTGWISGTITLDSGAALFEGSSGGIGPLSFFDGSNDVWTGDWYSSIKVYLDPELTAEGQGFEYIVSVNNESGSYLDEYGFSFTAGPSYITAGCISLTDTVNITTPGWYTLQHFFYDNGGVLFVDMKLIAPDTSLALDVTIDTTYLIPSDVSGNRYAKFTSLTDSNGILVDDFQRYSIP